MHNVSKHLLDFPFDLLVNAFENQYLHEHGEMKATAAIKTISDSSKVQNYLISLRTHSHYPASNDIVILLNSMSYFMFKNSETMCLAALTIANFGFSQYETLIKSIDDKIKTRIIIEIMIKCSNMKIVKTGRFFDRYFESLS